MKKWQAWLLAIGGITLIGAYAAWCARPFYNPPPVRPDSGVSQEMVSYISAWQQHARWFEPEPFSWKRYGQSLMHPYESGIRPVRVIRKGEQLFDDEEHVIAVHPSRPGWVDFSKDRFGWTPPVIQSDGPPGFTTKPKRMGAGGHGLHNPDKEFPWRGIPGMGGDAR